MGVLSSKEAGQADGSQPLSPDSNTLNLLHEDVFRPKGEGRNNDPSAQRDGSVAFHDDGTPLFDGSEDEHLVAVFRWEHGGNKVFLSGTFNNWKTNIPMHRGGNDFTYICSLPRGKHVYKFLVDGKWRFSPDHPTLADAQGNVNNLLDLTNFRSNLDEMRDWRDHIVPDDQMGQEMPSREDYGQEPPYLPPQLRHIILNHTAPEVHGVHLPIPQHVTLNHLYCTAIKDGLMVLSVTTRYKEKFVTTITYSLQDTTFDEVVMQHRNLVAQNNSIQEQYKELSRDAVGMSGTGSTFLGEPSQSL